MSIFAELKRRNVFRVAAGYIVLGWLLLQVTDVVVPILELPGWVDKLVLFLLVLGFPLVLFFAWAYELTPEGLKKEKDVDRTRSIASLTGRKLDRAIIGILVVALGYFVFDKFTHRAPEPAPAAVAPTGEAGPPEKSIAVLPFDNLSADEENAFFAAGVHEDVLTNLARISGLRVNSRTSVLQYADKKQNLKEISEALGATYILEGSVRRSANRVRVTAQLIDARNDVHLWAENFDRELTDIFEIQTAIAREITDSLEAELSPAEERLITARPTGSIEAYDLFLKARLALQDSDQSSTLFDTAVPLLEEAVRIDPDYAQAWALMAVAHGDMYWFRVDQSPTRLDRMKQALDRAFELRPDLPEARLAMGRYYYSGFYDYPKAREQLELARGIVPNEPLVHYHLGLTYRRLGLYDQSVQSFLHATELDPFYQGAWSEALNTATSAGLKEIASSIAEEIAERFPLHPRMVAERARMRMLLFGDIAGARKILDSLPEADQFNIWDARYYSALLGRDFQRAAQAVQAPAFGDFITPGSGKLEAARILIIGGHETEATPLLEEAGRLLAGEVAKPYADNFAWPHVYYAMYQVMTGHAAEAIESCNHSMAILPLEKDKVHGAAFLSMCAWVEGMAGNTDLALDMLGESLEVGWDMNYWILSLSPEWDFLRDNERFAQLLETAKAKMDRT